MTDFNSITTNQPLSFLKSPQWYEWGSTGMMFCSRLISAFWSALLAILESTKLTLIYIVDSIRRITLFTFVVVFALIGYGETYHATRTFVIANYSEKRVVSEFELIKRSLCLTKAGKESPDCP